MLIFVNVLSLGSLGMDILITYLILVQNQIVDKTVPSRIQGSFLFKTYAGSSTAVSDLVSDLQREEPLLRNVTLSLSAVRIWGLGCAGGMGSRFAIETYWGDDARLQKRILGG